jgi:sensor histidine kinase YesM
MRLKISKKQVFTAVHVLLWIISVNCWYFVFNPGVEASSFFSGVNDLWVIYLALNTLGVLYLSIPLVWFTGVRRWVKILLAVVFLLPVLSLVFEFLLTPEGWEDLIDGYFVRTFLYVVVFHLTIVVAVYFNLGVLADKYLKNSRFGAYVLSALLLVFVTAVLNFALFDYCIDKIFPSIIFISYFKLTEVFGIVAAYLIVTLAVFLVRQYAGMLISNREKAVNELSALKSQINPHFLFNNLNTIYSMASRNDERTKDVILQLSDFLRYVLYDTASEYIPLEKEVEIIKTYIELQKARVDPEITTIVLKVEGNCGNSQITPLLLLPLAENCFKHGIGKDPGEIRIWIGIEGNKLRFRTENAIAPRERNGETENGGIGINNVEKRLNLIYPGRHSIFYEGREGSFMMELKIEL